MPILTTLRSKTIDWFHSVESEEGSLYCHSDVVPFLKAAVPAYKKAMRNGDILATKILAYTNAMVASYNNCIRRVIWEDARTVEYHQFEFLTGYENLEFNGVKFWNSMDYIIVDEPVKRDIYIPGFMKVPGYELNMYDSTTDDRTTISMIARDLDSDYKSSSCHHVLKDYDYKLSILKKQGGCNNLNPLGVNIINLLEVSLLQSIYTMMED